MLDWRRRNPRLQDNGILEAKAEVRPAQSAIIEHSTADFDRLASYFDGAQSFVELNGWILVENPNDHAAKSSAPQILDDGVDQPPAHATPLAISEEVNGVKFRVIPVNGFSNRASRDEAEDA